MKIMGMLRWSFWIAVVLMILALLGRFLWKFQNDNPFEEFAESRFESETGLKIDISPGSDPS